MFFEDRKDAGQRMISMVEEYMDAPNAIVLGLPRGGIVVALEIALALKLPLDVWVTRKIGAPLNPELAIGSVDFDGNLLMDENATRMYEVSDRNVREMADEQIAEARRRYERYRGIAEPPDVKGKTVIVVDDGVATGFTMLAALKSLRLRGAEKIICVAPVASPRVMSRLEKNADAVQCFSTPSYFGAVGEFYRNFNQVSDEEVIACLEKARQHDAH
ncbi:MAG: phosphoribosyltransferase family protein [Thermoleophilia bacterium]|nr:phosphoribosyltransferase family protein [Thermoleophilia bacterium]